MGWMDFARTFDPGGAYLGSYDEKIQPRPDYPYMAGKDLYNWSSQYRKDNPYDPAAPYPGQLSAPMTGAEWDAQGMLQDYMGQGTPESLTAANKYTTDVLGGKYDPRTSDYYKNMRSQIMQDAKDTQSDLLHGSAKMGMLHSDPRRSAESDLSRKTSMDLSTLLAGLFEQERGRMGQAAGMAPTISKTMSDIPMQKITAGAGIGAIPRQVGQQAIGREYGEYQRQLRGARAPYEFLQNLSGKDYNPYPAQPFTTGSGGGGGGSLDLSSILSLVSLIASDRRFKGNIKYISGSPLEGVELATWEWNKIAVDKGIDGANIGFIAQDVEKLYPDAIVKRPDGYLMIDYSKLPIKEEYHGGNVIR